MLRIDPPGCPSEWKSLQASQDCRSRLVQSSLGKTHLCTAISGIGFCFQLWELTWSPQALISGKLRSSMKVNMVFPGGGPYTLARSKIKEFTRTVPSHSLVDKSLDTLLEYLWCCWRGEIAVGDDTLLWILLFQVRIHQSCFRRALKQYCTFLLDGFIRFYQQKKKKLQLFHKRVRVHQTNATVYLKQKLSMGE